MTAQPALRRELLLELVEREGIRIYLADPDDKLVPLPTRKVFELMTAEIQRDLGENTRFAIRRDGIEAFWVSFTIDEDEYWVALPRERVDPPLTWQWIGWGAAALVLALIGAYLIVYRIRSPLGALAEAARATGRGDRPEPLREAGPEELQALSRAFNQMAHDLARLDEDRALVLAGVSHDLRTPLTRLRLGIEMSGADERTRQEMAADIDDMDRIIGQFLDFARSAGGEAPQALDLAELAAQVAAQYAERGAPLATAIEPTPAITAQPLALRRLITNLIDNALRYAAQGIEIATCFGKDSVVIEVRDRGPGIPPADVDRLKKPFTQAQTARSNASGSGLGLAIVDRITKMHGGRLRTFSA